MVFIPFSHPEDLRRPGGLEVLPGEALEYADVPGTERKRATGRQLRAGVEVEDIGWSRYRRLVP
jgi:hypothetical protein